MSVDLPVHAFMQCDLLECAPSMSVREAAARMHDAHCGSILIVDAGKPVGIWTETDVLAGAWRSVNDLEQPVSAFMSAPVKSIAAQATLGEVARSFRLAGVRHFLVNDSQGSPLGIISQTDVVCNQAAEFFLPANSVASLVPGDPVCVDANTSFNDVRQLMRNLNIDAVVIRSGQGYGIITMRDVVGALGAKKLTASAGELASFPLLTIRRDATLFQARSLFSRNRIRHLGVIDDQQVLVGLLTFRDLFENIEHAYVDSLLPALELKTEKLLQTQRELVRQASLTEAVLNALPINVFVKDEAGRLIIANEMTAQTIGRPLAEIIGKCDAEMFPAEIAGPMIDDDAKVRSSNQTLIREELLADGRTLLGQKRMIQVEGAPLLLGASMDVTKWKRVDALMVSDHHVLELIAGGSDLPVILEALCRRMEIHLPGALCSILLLADDGVLRLGAAPNLPPEYLQVAEAASVGPADRSYGADVFFGEQVLFKDIASSSLWTSHADLARRCGLNACWPTPFFSAARQLLGVFAIYYTQTKHPDDNDLTVIGHATRLASVAVERWQQISELKRLATTDQLTELSNRAHFMESAEAELRRSCRFKRDLAVLMIDLDFFKRVNDRYGHAAGDEALRVFSRVLISETRAFDLLGRIGGEEFSVVLTETGSEVSLQIAERLRRAVELTSFVFQDSGPISFTVSIGVALLQAGDSLDSLLARADDALYRAKHAGRNRVECG
ncbi:diguanylate cyclase [Propionivibrio sp.]|uniref:diguanylate cyclase n=1 Tax=Propionivibrio sp. TaxID=2212460 RepID=UPI00260975A2|nr:diguanylate cyclase [Propionivibrio sp.]